MSIVEYLPCGCGIDSEGGRDYCPECAAKERAGVDKVIEEIDKILIAGHAPLIPSYTPTYIRDQILNIKVGNLTIKELIEGR